MSVSPVDGPVFDTDIRYYGERNDAASNGYSGLLVKFVIRRSPQPEGMWLYRMTKDGWVDDPEAFDYISGQSSDSMGVHLITQDVAGTIARELWGQTLEGGDDWRTWRVEER